MPNNRYPSVFEINPVSAYIEASSLAARSDARSRDRTHGPARPTNGLVPRYVAAIVAVAVLSAGLFALQTAGPAKPVDPAYADRLVLQHQDLAN